MRRAVGGAPGCEDGPCSRGRRSGFKPRWLCELRRRAAGRALRRRTLRSFPTSLSSQSTTSTTGWGAWGGHPQSSTPNIDRLARRSVHECTRPGAVVQRGEGGPPLGSAAPKIRRLRKQPAMAARDSPCRNPSEKRPEKRLSRGRRGEKFFTTLSKSPARSASTGGGRGIRRQKRRTFGGPKETWLGGRWTRRTPR